ncbi:MAG: hypothetical protein P9X24_04935 [Candidatus Hatepunaea meridiana]|nr:hypothetical protein [Candidatus Hatepunaea meridiana]
MPKRPEIPTWRPVKTRTGKTIYQLNYIDPITGKRHRPVGGYTETEARKEAFRIYEELKDKVYGKEKEQFPDIEISDLVTIYFRNKKGRVADSTLSSV